MSLSSAELALVGAELNGLVGARVQKVSAAGPRTVALELRQPGRSDTVLLEGEPAVGRVAVVERRPPAPERPLAFQGLLRAHLTGGRLDQVAVHGPEHVVELHFSTDRGRRSLVLEVDRRGGEVLLLDGQETIVGSGGGERLRERGLRRGASYLLPAPSDDGGRTRFEAGDGPFPVSAAIEGLYGAVTRDRRRDRARVDLLGPLRTARKRLERTLGKIDADRARIAEAARYREMGDLLKPHLATIKRGQVTATVTGYTAEGPQERVVPLMPHLSARENLERYYHLHRRLARSAGRVEERRALVARRLARCVALLAEGEASTDEAALEAVGAAARAEGLVQAPRLAHARDDEVPRRPFREYLSLAGRRIWVGRNARDNDALTFRLARGNDLWLHARGLPGSHVVVPGVGHDGPDGETLLDAATLAAHFSGGREELVVDVAVTRRKHVHKPKGAAAGAVHFSQDRNLPLRFEAARLERLLASEQDAG